MSRNETVARPYAKAAFELAQAEKAYPQWSEMLYLAAQTAKDEQVANRMKDPNYSQEQWVQLFLGVGEGCYTQEMQNFIRVLAQFKRLAFLPEIALLYEAMRAHAERIVTVELISAQPVDEKMQSSFVDALKRRMQCDVLLKCMTDKSIIGGAIVRSGDWVLDGSVRGRLAKLSDAVGIS